MKWIWGRVQWLQAWVALPSLLTLTLVICVFAYFAGLLFWYGIQMANIYAPAPIWSWPFIPDCPLAGLLGGLGLMMVTAHKFWRPEAQARAQRLLLIVGGVSALLWLSTYLPGAPILWQQLGPTLGVWSWALLLCGALFHKAPAWLLGVIAFGEIKYGIWTVVAWLVYWRNTALMDGAPDFNFISILMTVSHLALLGMGVFLLTYFKPTRAAVLASLFWYALSDFMDYGLGFYPGLPLKYIPLWIMQWHTIAVTFLLSGVYFWLSSSPSLKSTVDTVGQGRAEQLPHPSV